MQTSLPSSRQLHGPGDHDQILAGRRCGRGVQSAARTFLGIARAAGQGHHHTAHGFGVASRGLGSDRRMLACGPMLTFCSIVTPSTRAQARVMADSVRRHYPDARVLALVEGAGQSEDADDRWDTADLPSGAAIPELLKDALASADLAVYLAPDVCVYDGLEPILSAAAADGVALVPRASSLPDDGLEPDYGALLDAGEISPAIVAVAHGEPGTSFVEWWLRRQSESVVSNGRWLGLAHEQLQVGTVVRDPGCNVSYWNLHERRLARDR